MTKYLITGSRGLTDIAPLWRKFNEILKPNDIIIHGGAKGVDSMASSYCIEHKDIKEIIIRPIYPSKKDYYLHRNAEMVGMCDKVIAYWDGESRGTKFTINYARKRFKDVILIKG